MAYSDFTLPEVTKRFQLAIHEQSALFAQIEEVQPSDLLHAILAENVPLALAIQTEKARSELIIAPILVEVRRLLDRQISLFSGVDFTVDPARGLNGICDYIVSQSTEQLFVRAPVLAIVEAKNENFKAGFAQCIAAMVAAQIFNERESTGISNIYGIVTTGSIWRFLQLTGTQVDLDIAEYYLDRVSIILGILLHIIRQSGDSR